MATSAAEIEFVSDEPIEFVPEDDAAIEFVPDDEVATEAMRASMGAAQAVDVMGAPGRLDWSGVNEDLDAERFREAEGLRAQYAGKPVTPETRAMRARELEIRSQISPFTQAGQYLERGAAEAEQANAEVAASDRGSSLFGRFFGPALFNQVGATVDAAGRNIGPAIGGAAGAAAFMHPGTGLARIGLSMMGGFMGAQTGGMGQEALLQASETDEQSAERQARWAQSERESPGSSLVGRMLASGPFFRPGIAQFGRAAAGDTSARLNLAAAAGIGAGAEVVGATIQGQPIEARNVLAGMATNMFMNEPTKLGRRMGFPQTAEEIAVTAIEGPRETSSIPIRSSVREPIEFIADDTATRPTTSTVDVFENVQRRPTEVDQQPIQPPDEAAPIVQPAEAAAAPRTPGSETVLPSAEDATPAPAVEPVVAPESPIVEEAGRALPPPTGGEEATGIRNAVVDENRRLAGLPEREKPLARSFPMIHEEAKAALARDPEMGRRLVAELSQDIRPLTDAEDAVLTFEQNTREQERAAAVDLVNNAKTPEEMDAAQQRLAQADNDMFNIYQVGQKAGTENARGLNARRLMQNRDFTLAKMLNETRAIANDGQPLSAEQTAEVTKAHARIAELEAKLAEAENKGSAADAQVEFRRILRETTAEAKKAAKSKESQTDFLTRTREAAKHRIAARRGRLTVTVDPLNIAGLVDEAIVGATYVAEGVRDFARWSSRMVSEFGERIRPQLQALFSRATQLSDDLTKPYQAAAALTPEQALAKIQPGQPLEQKAVFDLYRAHVNAGVTDFETATKAVTGDLQKAFPGVTERQVRDALSQYGKTTTPSKEADLVKLREFRNLARLTSQLEDAQKKIAPLKTGPQRDKQTAKVRELQKQVNAAIKAAGFKSSGPESIATAHDARVNRLKNAIEETELAIQNRKRPDRPDGVEWTPEELALKQQLAEARERLDDVLGQPENDRLRNVLRSIERAEEKIRTGKIDPKTGRFGPDTKEVAEAVARLKEANRTLAEMRKAKRQAENPPKTEDQKRLAALEKNRDELLDRISKGNIAPKSGRPTVDTQAQAAVKAEIRALNKQIADLRNSSDELRLERDKRAIQARIRDYQDKIARGDYEEPAPRREPALDREKIDLEYKLAKEKEQWQQGVIEAKRAKRPIGQKIWDSVKEGANLSRAMLTSMDLPPVFRQGLFSIGRPVTMAKATKDALLSIPSAKKAFEVQREIENRPNAPLYQRAKLYLAKDTAQPLSQQEEAYMGNWFRKLPRWSVIGPVLRASERGYNIFLNRLRADTFDAAVKAYDVSATDTATLRRLADIINTMTGRSTLPGQLEKAAVGLNTFLFAPRFMASRFKLVTGEPLWTGNAKTRAFALEQYGRTLAGAAVIYALAKSAGFEVETDPRSSEFGKIRIGSTMLDPLGGLSQVTTFLTRVITGETKTGKGKVVPLREPMRPLVAMDEALGTNVAARGRPNRFSGDTSSVIGRFLRTKLNPVAGTAVNVATGTNIVGEPVTPQSAIVGAAVPISFQDILKTMESQGVPRGTALFIISLFGAGLQEYE